MKIFCSIIFALIAAFAANGQAAQMIKVSDITAIILKTGDGFCFDCERITTLRGDGAAKYHGGKNSRVRKGDYSGDIGKTNFARLAKIIVEAGFFDFKLRYEGKTSDVATVEITVVHSGERSKTVENFGRSDEPKLKIIERAFDAATDKIKWRNQKPAPAERTKTKIKMRKK